MDNDNKLNALEKEKKELFVKLQAIEQKIRSVKKKESRKRYSWGDNVPEVLYCMKCGETIWRCYCKQVFDKQHPRKYLYYCKTCNSPLHSEPISPTDIVNICGDIDVIEEDGTVKRATCGNCYSTGNLNY